jgi:aminopeptidase N
MKPLFMTGLFVLWHAFAIAQDIDIKHIKLNLSFDWQKRQAIGSVEITCSTKRESNTIALDAGYLSVEKIVPRNQNLFLPKIFKTR